MSTIININVILKEIHTIKDIKEMFSQKYKYICFSGDVENNNYGKSLVKFKSIGRLHNPEHIDPSNAE